MWRRSKPLARKERQFIGQGGRGATSLAASFGGAVQAGVGMGSSRGGSGDLCRISPSRRADMLAGMRLRADFGPSRPIAALGKLALSAVPIAAMLGKLAMLAASELGEKSRHAILFFPMREIASQAKEPTREN